MTFIRLGFLSLICALYAPWAWSQMFVPVTALERAADLVVLATVDSIVEPGGNATRDVTVQLHVVQVLKGATPSSELVAGVAALSQGNPGPIALTSGIVGSTGIWFLKSGSLKYQILPRAQFAYLSGDLFLPVAGDPTPVPSANALDDQLLAYMVRWYQSLTSPNAMLDDTMLLSSFEQWSAESPTPQQVISAVAPLIQSPSPSQRIVGLTAALRVGSSGAMTTVVDQLSVLASDPRFPDITSTLGVCPKDASWLAPLQQFVALQTDIPGMDVAVVGALRKIGTKAVLPIMADLLDSKDPKAQVGAAWYFGMFALLANAQGEILPSAPNGPFATADTQALTPRPTTPPTAASQYSAFWKTWWAQYRAQLGFPAP